MSIAFWIPFFLTPPPAHHALPGASSCSTRGAPLVEITDRSERSSATRTTTIFSSGAWSVTDGRTRERGCFEHDEMRSLRRAVQRAPWEVTYTRIACFAYDPSFTEYLVRGELRFTEQLCSGRRVDAVTARAIELIKSEVEEERLEHAPSPVVTPAPLPQHACRAAGTPLFEIRKLSNVPQPSSTTAIYASGAWTFQPIDKDGRLGAQTTGCLTPAMTASLRQLIQRSPWTSSRADIVCKAYSPSYTEYFVHGQREYTARLCGAERLDEKSLGAIQIIERELSAVVPQPPST